MGESERERAVWVSGMCVVRCRHMDGMSQNAARALEDAGKIEPVEQQMIRAVGEKENKYKLHSRGIKPARLIPKL